MAKLNINILNPIIKLITNYDEISNSCITLFTFDIVTVAGNSIIIDLVKDINSPQDYETAQISIDGGASNVPILSGDPHILPGGKAAISITIGNTGSTSLNCNEVVVTATDINLAISESTRLIRCNKGSRC